MELSQSKITTSLAIPSEIMHEIERVKRQYGWTMSWQIQEALKAFHEKYPNKEKK